MVKVVTVSQIDAVAVGVIYGDEIGGAVGDGLTFAQTRAIGNLTAPGDTFPTVHDGTGCNALTNPTNAFLVDAAYAIGSADLDAWQDMYEGFGFAIPAGKVITYVEVVLYSGCNQAGATHTVGIGKPGTPDTCTNFTDYPEGAASGSVADPIGGGSIRRPFDVTNTGHAFVPSDFDNANLRLLLSVNHGMI